MRKIFLSVVLMAFIASCTPKKEVLAEPVKDLNATWRIADITRNAVDITAYVDSAGFRLTLSGDKTYTLEGNNIPFLVNTASGTWSSDDPQYPYNLTLTPTDSTTSYTGSIATPVSGGQRTLSITFSPGCYSNTYIYTFEKMNP
ncbi:DUF5004 domain-containing protein [Parafilimonas sp.]|uniref:DUF5004 domain-containing protein n=1 Tax=Parafilimonas sp. TaxID=1969739 RepID=UPI0039E5C55C